jgi:[protein-PII] uridylyltransferase
VAVVALGGYGRSEQCLYSDIDVMLLHDGADIDRITRAVLYPLWDANLKVGHAVRTVKECAVAGAEAFDTLTSLLSFRHVAGDASLTARLEQTVVDLVRGRPLEHPLAEGERERRATIRTR